VKLYYLIISTPTQHVKDTSITNENISLCRLTQRACIRQPPNIWILIMYQTKYFLKLLKAETTLAWPVKYTELSFSCWYNT